MAREGPTRVDALLGELRTKEAYGHGTEARLVLLEAIQLEGCLHQLDEFVASLAGGWPGLLRATRVPDPVMDRLEQEWAGLDLQECTMRMREVDELLRILLPDPVG